MFMEMMARFQQLTLVATHDVSASLCAGLIDGVSIAIGTHGFSKMQGQQRTPEETRNQAAKEIPEIKGHTIPHNDFSKVCLYFCFTAIV
jgi:nucleoid DNA-binding protein